MIRSDDEAADGRQEKEGCCLGVGVGGAETGNGNYSGTHASTLAVSDQCQTPGRKDDAQNYV